jgi:uncharacterized protein YbjT (DUF2867 family)
MKLLVTGASGVLGREVLLAARSVGMPVRAMSRRPPAEHTDGEGWVQADLVTGPGIDDALLGCDTIVHAATDPRKPDGADVNGTRRLIEAAARAGIRHLVFVSIVGVDQVPYPYYRRKLAAEQIVSQANVPFSILRATQFHSFLEQLIASAARVPVVLPVPAGFVVQPVEVSEVAERLVRCIADGPRGRLTDFGGPEVLSFTEAARQWKQARNVAKRIVPIPVPGSMARAIRAGKGTAPLGDKGTISWPEWLRQTRDE